MFRFLLNIVDMPFAGFGGLLVLVGLALRKRVTLFGAVVDSLNIVDRRAGVL